MNFKDYLTEDKSYTNDEQLNEAVLTLYDGEKMNLSKVEKVLKEVSKIKSIEEMEKYFKFSVDQEKVDENKPFKNQGIFADRGAFSVKFEGLKYASRWIFVIDLMGNITSSSKV